MKNAIHKSASSPTSDILLIQAQKRKVYAGDRIRETCTIASAAFLITELFKMCLEYIPFISDNKTEDTNVLSLNLFAYT